MANTDNPRGLWPIRHQSGAPWNGQLNMYYIDAAYATALGKGDLVQLAGGANESANATGTCAAIQRYAVAQANTVGVIMGFGDSPTQGASVDDLTLNYSPTSTAHYAFVCDDPTVIFGIQDDSKDGTALTIDAIGGNAEIATIAACDTTTGYSKMELDSTSVTTTSTLPLKVLRLINRPDNALGEAAEWEVMLQTHSYGGGVGNPGRVTT